jgi:hypothetical protein
VQQTVRPDAAPVSWVRPECAADESLIGIEGVPASVAFKRSGMATPEKAARRHAAEASRRDPADPRSALARMTRFERHDRKGTSGNYADVVVRRANGSIGAVLGLVRDDKAQKWLVIGELLCESKNRRDNSPDDQQHVTCNVEVDHDVVRPGTYTCVKNGKG